MIAWQCYSDRNGDRNSTRRHQCMPSQARSRYYPRLAVLSSRCACVLRIAKYRGASQCLMMAHTDAVQFMPIVTSHILPIIFTSLITPTIIDKCRKYISAQNYNTETEFTAGHKPVHISTNKKLLACTQRKPLLCLVTSFIRAEGDR